MDDNIDDINDDESMEKDDRLKHSSQLHRTGSSLSINSDSASGTSTPNRSLTPASSQLNLGNLQTNNEIQSIINMRQIFYSQQQQQNVTTADNNLLQDPLTLISLGYSPMSFRGSGVGPLKPGARSRGRPKKDSPAQLTKSPPSKIKQQRTRGPGQRTKTLGRINAAHRQKVDKPDESFTSTSMQMTSSMNPQMMAAMSALRTPELTFVNPFTNLVPGLSNTPFVAPMVPHGTTQSNNPPSTAIICQEESTSNASESVTPTTPGAATDFQDLGRTGERLKSQDSSLSDNLTEEDLKRCSLCNCTNKSVLGQGSLLRFDPTNDYDVFSKSLSLKNEPISDGDDKNLDRSQKPLTWRRNRGPCKTISKERSKSPRIDELNSTSDVKGSEDVLNAIGFDEVNVHDVYERTGHTWVHQNCATWSEGVVQTESYNLLYVDKAVFSSLTEKCALCKRYGASIPCQECVKKYHFPCAAASGCFQDMKTYNMLCPDHAILTAAIVKDCSPCIVCDQLGNIQELLFCTTCGQHYHGQCLDPHVSVTQVVRAGWQCPDCKLCQSCREPGDDMRILVCDTCDKAFHTYCLKPPVTSIPKNGWKCAACRVCSDCGSRTPGSGPSSRWHLHFTVCDSCYQQRNKGVCCPECGSAYRQFTHRDMVLCSSCNKYVHVQCAKNSFKDLDKTKLTQTEYICTPCKHRDKLQPNFNQIPMSNLSSMPLSISSTPSLDMMVTKELELEKFDSFNTAWKSLDLPKKDIEEGLSYSRRMSETSLKSSFPDNLSGYGDSTDDLYAFDKFSCISDSQTSLDDINMMELKTSGASQVYWPISDIGRKKPSRGKGGTGKGGSNTGKRRPPKTTRTEERKRNKQTKNCFGMLVDGTKHSDDEQHSTVIVCGSNDDIILKQDVCVSCGSIGRGDEGRLIACAQCGQCYHPYCVNLKLNPIVIEKGWRCLDCTVCEGCGKPHDESRLILCDDCDISYHIYCLDPPLDHVPKGSWKCKRCVMCKSCGSTVPGYRCQWKNNCTQCGPCASLTTCPICVRNYIDSELIVMCANCERWLHADCDGIRTEEEADRAVENGYHCILCRPFTGQHGPLCPPTPIEVEKQENLQKTITPTNLTLNTTQSPKNQNQDHPLTPKSVKRYMLDGVFLSERGIDHIRSLTIKIPEKPKRARRPKMTGDKQKGQLNRIFNELEETDDGKERRKNRRVQLLGIGGFCPRKRTPARGGLPRQRGGSRLLNRMDSQIEAQDDLEMENGKRKRKPFRRARRCYLEEYFPSYLQEAFFGKNLVDKSKNPEGKELDDEKEDGGSDLGKGSVLGYSSKNVIDRTISDSATNFVATPPRQQETSDQHNDQNYDDDLKDLIPSDVDMELFINTNLKTELDGKDDILDPSIDNDESIHSVDDINLPQDLNKLEVMDSRTVEELLGVMNDEDDNVGPSNNVSDSSTPSNSGPPSVAASSTDGSTVPQGPLSGGHSMPGTPDSNNYPLPAMHGFASGVSTCQQQHGINLPAMSPRESNMPRYSIPQSSPTIRPPSLMHVSQPRQSPSTYSQQSSTVGHGQLTPTGHEYGPYIDNRQQNTWSQHQTPQTQHQQSQQQQSVETDSYSKRNIAKWQMDEPLGGMATISPVLYCNMQHPDLKEKYPDWNERAKQIAKLWRKVATDVRAPYLTKARENRAASRLNKAQKVTNDLRKRKTTPTTTEMPPPPPPPKNTMEPPSPVPLPLSSPLSSQSSTVQIPHASSSPVISSPTITNNSPHTYGNAIAPHTPSNDDSQQSWSEKQVQTPLSQDEVATSKEEEKDEINEQNTRKQDTNTGAEISTTAAKTTSVVITSTNSFPNMNPNRNSDMTQMNTIDDQQKLHHQQIHHQMGIRQPLRSPHSNQQYSSAPLTPTTPVRMEHPSIRMPGPILRPQFTSQGKDIHSQSSTNISTGTRPMHPQDPYAFQPNTPRPVHQGQQNEMYDQYSQQPSTPMPNGPAHRMGYSPAQQYRMNSPINNVNYTRGPQPQETYTENQHVIYNDPTNWSYRRPVTMQNYWPGNPNGPKLRQEKRRQQEMGQVQVAQMGQHIQRWNQPKPGYPVHSYMENDGRQHIGYPNVTVGPRTTGEAMPNRWPVQGYQQQHNHMMRPEMDTQYRPRNINISEQQQYMNRPPLHYPPGHPGNMIYNQERMRRLHEQNAMMQRQQFSHQGQLNSMHPNNMQQMSQSSSIHGQMPVVNSGNPSMRMNVSGLKSDQDLDDLLAADGTFNILDLADGDLDLDQDKNIFDEHLGLGKSNPNVSDSDIINSSNNQIQQQQTRSTIANNNLQTLTVSNRASAPPSAFVDGTFDEDIDENDHEVTNIMFIDGTMDSDNEKSDDQQHNGGRSQTIINSNHELQNQTPIGHPPSSVNQGSSDMLPAASTLHQMAKAHAMSRQSSVGSQSSTPTTPSNPSTPGTAHPRSPYGMHPGANGMSPRLANPQGQISMSSQTAPNQQNQMMIQQQQQQMRMQMRPGQPSPQQIHAMSNQINRMPVRGGPYHQQHVQGQQHMQNQYSYGVQPRQIPPQMMHVDGSHPGMHQMQYSKHAQMQQYSQHHRMPVSYQQQYPGNQPLQSPSHVQQHSPMPPNNYMSVSQPHQSPIMSNNIQSPMIHGHSPMQQLQHGQSPHSSLTAQSPVTSCPNQSPVASQSPLHHPVPSPALSGNDTPQQISSPRGPATPGSLSDVQHMGSNIITSMNNEQFMEGNQMDQSFPTCSMDQSRQYSAIRQQSSIGQLLGHQPMRSTLPSYTQAVQQLPQMSGEMMNQQSQQQYPPNYAPTRQIIRGSQQVMYHPQMMQQQHSIRMQQQQQAAYYHQQQQQRMQMQQRHQYMQHVANMRQNVPIQSGTSRQMEQHQMDTPVSVSVSSNLSENNNNSNVSVRNSPTSTVHSTSLMPNTVTSGDFSISTVASPVVSTNSSPAHTTTCSSPLNKDRAALLHEQPLLLQDLVEQEKQELQRQAKQQSLIPVDQQQPQQQQPCTTTATTTITTSTTSTTSCDNNMQSTNQMISSTNINQQFNQNCNMMPRFQAPMPHGVHQRHQMHHMVQQHSIQHRLPHPSMQYQQQAQSHPEFHLRQPPPAPPLPENDSNHDDRARYEQWLLETDKILAGNCRLVEEKINSLRKVKKSCAAKNRQAKKAGNEVPECDLAEIDRLTSEISSVQKQVEMAKKQQKAHQQLAQDYHQKNQERYGIMQMQQQQSQQQQQQQQQFNMSQHQQQQQLPPPHIRCQGPQQQTPNQIGNNTRMPGQPPVRLPAQARQKYDEYIQERLRLRDANQNPAPQVLTNSTKVSGCQPIANKDENKYTIQQDENNPFSDNYQHREHLEKLHLQEQQRIQMEQHLKQQHDSPQGPVSIGQPVSQHQTASTSGPGQYMEYRPRYAPPNYSHDGQQQYVGQPRFSNQQIRYPGMQMDNNGQRIQNLPDGSNPRMPYCGPQQFNQAENPQSAVFEEKSDDNKPKRKRTKKKKEEGIPRMSPSSNINSSGPVSELQRLANMQPQVSPLHTSFPKISPSIGNPRPESVASDKSEISRPSSSSGMSLSVKQERDGEEENKDMTSDDKEDGKNGAHNAVLKQLLNNKQKAAMAAANSSGMDDSNQMDLTPHSQSPSSIPLTPQQQQQLALIESMPTHIEREEWSEHSPMPMHPQTLMSHHISPEHLHMIHQQQQQQQQQSLPPSNTTMDDNKKKPAVPKQQRQRKVEIKKRQRKQQVSPVMAPPPGPPTCPPQIDNYNSTVVEQVMGSLRNLPNCNLEEPIVIFSNGVVPIKGQPNNFSQSTILAGKYGGAVISMGRDNVPDIDFYATGKFQVVKSEHENDTPNYESENLKSEIDKNAEELTEIDIKHDDTVCEKPIKEEPMCTSPTSPQELIAPQNSLTNRIYMMSRNSDQSPATVVSMSPPVDNNDNNDKLVKLIRPSELKSLNVRHDCSSPDLPLVKPIARRALNLNTSLPKAQTTNSADKSPDFSESRKSPNLYKSNDCINDDTEVTLTLNVKAPEDIHSVLNTIADLLKITVPPTYSISRSPSPEAVSNGQSNVTMKEDAVNIQSLIKSKPRMCKNCDIMILKSAIRKRKSDYLSKSEFDYEDEDLMFCGSTCSQAYSPEEFYRKTKFYMQHQKEAFMSSTSTQTVVASSTTPTKTIDKISPSTTLSCSVSPDSPTKLSLKVLSTAAMAAVQQHEQLMEQPKHKRLKHIGWKRWDSTCPKPIKPSENSSKDDFKELMIVNNVAMRLKPIPDDIRKCCLCGLNGDGKTDGPGRLLNYEVASWVHLNCALWSSEVYETMNGSLIHVTDALKRGKTMKCSKCRLQGATLSCFKTTCLAPYHVKCAKLDGCTFFQDKTILCNKHKSLPEPEGTLNNLKVFRKVYVSRNETQQIASVVHKSEERQCKIRIGSLILEAIGQLLPQQISSNNFHTANCIYPVGFRTRRLYWSYRTVKARCRYDCLIEEENGKPKFFVFTHESGAVDESFSGNTPSEAWMPILKSVEKLRLKADLVNVFPAFVNGEQLFGLTEPIIVRVLESLPCVEMLNGYNFKFGRTPYIEPPLAINPSGCARSEPKMQTHMKIRPLPGMNTSNTSPIRHPHQNASFSVSTLDIYNKHFVSSKSQQYKKLKTEWRNNVYLRRSNIQGLGLYAARDLDRHNMVIEYVGEQIRSELCDIRERCYDQQNRGVYMFRLNDSFVIDATMSGGPARYINHSCNPNCVAEVVAFERGDLKIIIIAKRLIKRGEELTYDYKFDFEDDQHKIPCLCNSSNCRKWMN